MSSDVDQAYESVSSWAKAHGIAVHEAPLAANKAGVFNGTSVTMNATYSVEERTFYLAHALGSMVRWSLSLPEVQALFRELRTAKKEANPEKLRVAITRYQAFEIE